jgi:membrane-bound acyltransferase YfiQ involved in biofilm formation
LMKTNLNNILLPILFLVVDNIVPGHECWTILLHPIQAQKYCSILLDQYLKQTYLLVPLPPSFSNYFAFFLKNRGKQLPKTFS